MHKDEKISLLTYENYKKQADLTLVVIISLTFTFFL